PPRGARAGRVRPRDHAALHVVRQEALIVLAALASGLVGAAPAIIVVTSVALCGFGANLLYLSWRAIKLRPTPGRLIDPGTEQLVCVQVPIYNERYVAERVLDAVCGLDWPRDLLEIQVLDDSDDETTSIIALRAAHWRRRGRNITHVRRASRE